MYKHLLFYGGGRRYRHLSRACRAISSKAAPPPSAPPATTKAELDGLREQIRTLQELVRQTNAQSRSAERSAGRVEAKVVSMERSLAEIHDQTVRVPIVDRVSEAVLDHVHRSPSLTKVLDQLNKHRGLLNRKTAAALAVAAVLIWQCRAAMYQRTSREVADLASRTLEQESLRESIQETLEAVASSPETLEALNELLQRILRDPSTQKVLVDLVVYAVGTEQVRKALQLLAEGAFVDPHLQRLTGEFLLKGLDERHVREMLEAQTQALVRKTLLDESVQRATGIGVRKSLWYAAAPPFLYRRNANTDEKHEQEVALLVDGDGAEAASNGQESES